MKKQRHSIIIGMKGMLLLILLILQCPHLTLQAEASKYDYLYIEAIRQQDQGNYSMAFELYRKCHRLRPEAAETNYAMGQFYIAMNQDSLGIAHLKKAVETEPDNTEFAEKLAQVYLYRNDVPAATEVYEDLVKRDPTRTDYLELLCRIYEQTRDYEKLLATLNKLEVQEGQSEDITLSKMQAYSYMDNQEGAYAELKSLVDAHPNDLNLQVMMGNWFFTNGRKQEARQTFLRVLQEEPENVAGQMSLMDFYRAQGENESADSIMQAMMDNPHTDDETRVALIYQWMKAEPNDSIRNRKGLEQILAITPEDMGARLDLLQMMWNDSIDENVVNECKKAVEYVPNEPSLYFYLGMAQFINKHHEDAIASLKLGVANITSETKRSLIADIYNLLGDVLQKEGRMDEAYAAYDSCLVYDPDKILCLNNYAYFLAEANKELKKAEEMSHKAITAEPENPIYLDTYAWILYKEERYEEAKIYIDMTFKYVEDPMDDDNKELRDHRDAIYNKLNITH